MKTILVLAASALCVFSAKADEDYATIVSYLGTEPTAAETVPSSGPVITHIVVPSATPTQAPRPGVSGAADQITNIERSFDLDKRPGEIAEVLQNAGYNLTIEELNVIRSFIEDYGWYFVIGKFRDTEIALVRFRFFSHGNDQEFVQLGAIADELATNKAAPFIDHLVLKKYGLIQSPTPTSGCVSRVDVPAPSSNSSETKKQEEQRQQAERDEQLKEFEARQKSEPICPFEHLRRK